MKSGPRATGFTIIEVMIVLAVSMALFISAIVLVEGKQRRTEFTQGVRLLQTQLQQTVNDVASGYYKNDGTFSCAPTLGGFGLIVPTITSGGGSQKALGTNQGCIFMGKAMQFTQTSGNPTGSIQTYTVAGLQTPNTTGSGPAGPLFPFQPRIITVPASAFDAYTVPYSMTIKGVYYNKDPVNNPIGAFGIISSTGSIGDGDGTASVNLVAVTGTHITDAVSSGQANINSNLAIMPATLVNPSKGIQICLGSGGSNQVAILTIGGEDSNTVVTTVIKDGNICS